MTGGAVRKNFHICSSIGNSPAAGSSLDQTRYLVHQTVSQKRIAPRDELKRHQTEAVNVRGGGHARTP